MFNRRRSTTLALALVPLLSVLVAGCGSKTRTATAAAAGAAAAVVLNDQNAEGEVHASIAETDRRARAVLASMELPITKSARENNGTELEYEARSGDRVVHVKLEQPAGSHMTKVSVSSRRGTTLDYDVSHARMILQRIQEQR